jgi:hypothetical protein
MFNCRHQLTNFLNNLRDALPVSWFLLIYLLRVVFSYPRFHYGAGGPTIGPGLQPRAVPDHRGHPEAAEVVHSSGEAQVRPQRLSRGS